jgi:hypothetical protein
VPSSGKWYLEITLGTVGANSFIGLAGTTPIFNSYCIYGINGFGFLNSGWGSPSSTVSGTGAAGDVIGLAFDVDAKTLQFYKNGSSIGTISAFTFPQNWSIGFRCNAAVTTPWVFNFGQRAFAYTAPSGFKALCTANLPAPLVTKPSTVMDVLLWTGNGSTQTISGLGFEPDMVWLKRRSATANNRIYDQIRGATKSIYTDLTDAEGTESTGLTAFTSTGFSLGDQAGHNSLNGTFVGWCWDAGSSTVTNTQGSITNAQVRANTTAGFSVITITTPSSGTFTFGHGLGIAPSLLICKSRTSAYSWPVYHRSNGAGAYLYLNSTAATASSNIWQNTNPTSTLVYGDSSNWGTNEPYVIYAFAPQVGYSSFGSYTGNGSSDGPFVYTGFRPRWVMVKASTSVSFGSWRIYDSARGSYNVIQQELYANLSNSEDASNTIVDFLSNGFKLRSGAIDGYNGSGATIIYAAFAESPFNYARAR